MNIAALCDQDTAVGLQLVGIKDLYVVKENALSLWNNLSKRNDIGLILITERFAKILTKPLHDVRIRSTIPIILEIPDKKGRLPDHIDYVSQLIKKAVGIEIKR